MQALAERLDAEIAGSALEAVEPLGFSALKTVVPSPDSFIGATLEHVGRYAKYLILDFGDSRQDPDPPVAGRAARRGGAAEAHAREGLGGAAPLLERQGHARARVRPRAQGGVVGAGAGRRRPARHARSRTRFRRVRRADPPRRRPPACPHAAPRPAHGRGCRSRLRRRRVVARAAVARTRRFDHSTTTSARDCSTRSAACSPSGLELERGRTGGLSQPKLGEHFEVHARAGTPCPRCGETLRRVSYESHEVVYCPNCQTNGKVLADRRMSTPRQITRTGVSCEGLYAVC